MPGDSCASEPPAVQEACCKDKHANSTDDLSCLAKFPEVGAAAGAGAGGRGRVWLLAL